jgi:mRNA interferase MazF
MIRRGDVVLARVPDRDSGDPKSRPVVVIQGDEYNATLEHTVVVPVTSSLSYKASPTRLLLDPDDSEGRAAGVPRRSLILCERPFTIDQGFLGPKIGHLAFGTMDRVDDCLRVSLGLPPQAEPTMGDYEKWPGFLKVKERLEFFLEVMKLNVTGSAFMRADIEQSPGGRIDRISGVSPNLVLPKSKEEFQQAGHSIRLAFQAAGGQSSEILGRLAPVELDKVPLFRVVIWAYSGPSNSVSCAYSCERLNDGQLEVYIASLSNDVYELGFDASGNVFDALLIGDQLRLNKAPNTGER